MRWLIVLAVLLSILAACPAGVSPAAEPGITIDTGTGTLTLLRDQILKRRDLTTILVPRDVTYKRAMTYRAVPLASLLADASLGQGETSEDMIEIVAADGFVSVLPLSLVFAQSARASVPYLAVEPVDSPWPAIPGKNVDAGPFYVVWLRPEASGIRSEQWPYMVASIRGTESPVHRWPQLGVDPALPPDSPIRAGQALFVTQCMACHPLNGAGNAHVGPDLDLPWNPTEYLTPAALRQLVRDPASVRSWPGMQMPGFDKDALSDAEIDLIARYLAHMAERKKG